MLSVDEALNLIARHAAPLAPRRVALANSLGLVLAEDIASDVNSPPHDKALMDGYAVRSADRQAEREILEEIAAGAVPTREIVPGTASRIMTGAPIPPGADAIVPVEQTELIGDAIVRLAQVAPSASQHILPLGASMRIGQKVLGEGAEIRPIEIAILAECGRSTVSVVPRPRLAVLSTGNELVPVDQLPQPGQIRNSNGPMLMACAARAGAEGIDLGIAHDTADELRSRIERGLEADILILSGGVSAGKFDLVPSVLADLGVEQVFHKVALRPGKPLWFGVKQNGKCSVRVLGLPGNPVSSLVCFELFVRPLVAALAGKGFRGAPRQRRALAHAHDHAGARAAFLPARAASQSEGQAAATVEILPWQGSADVASLAPADCLVCLPAERRQIAAGDAVEVLLFDER